MRQYLKYHRQAPRKRHFNLRSGCSSHIGTQQCQLLETATIVLHGLYNLIIYCITDKQTLTPVRQFMPTHTYCHLHPHWRSQWDTITLLQRRGVTAVPSVDRTGHRSVKKAIPPTYFRRQRWRGEEEESIAIKCGTKYDNKEYGRHQVNDFY